MVMKGHSTLPKAPALLEPHYQIVLFHIPDTHWVGAGLTSLQRCNRCIPQPQLTGIDGRRKVLYLDTKAAKRTVHGRTKLKADVTLKFLCVLNSLPLTSILVLSYCKHWIDMEFSNFLFAGTWKVSPSTCCFRRLLMLLILSDSFTANLKMKNVMTDFGTDVWK